MEIKTGTKFWDGYSSDTEIIEYEITRTSEKDNLFFYYTINGSTEMYGITKEIIEKSLESKVLQLDRKSAYKQFRNRLTKQFHKQLKEYTKTLIKNRIYTNS